MILQSIMAVRAEVAAEKVDKGLGTLRLQEKMNCVRQYEALGAKQEVFRAHVQARCSFPACATRRLYT